MKQIFNYVLVIVAILLIGWKLYSTSTSTQGAEFPSQPIQIVVPYQAGGGSDTFARIFQQALSKNEDLGVPIVVVNRPGGSATIGSRFVKNSRPDGYRLLCHHEGIIATKLAGTVPYGHEAFVPVAETGAKILVMIVRADSEYRDLPSLLEAAQKNPNTIRVGANQGSPAWFICKQLLAEYPGAEFNFIPADGSKRISYLLGGKLEAGVFSLDEYIANRNSDDAPPSENIMASANFSPNRHPDIPDVSTSLEQGMKTHAENAFYFWAPKETPDEIVSKLADALEAACKDPDVIRELNRLSIPIVFRRGDALAKHLEQRVEAFESIAVKVDNELPDFAVWLIGIVGVLLLAVVGERWFSKSRDETDSGDLNEANKPGKAEEAQPSFAANMNGLICLGLLAGYVLLLQFVPFAIATPLAIFLLGATIANWNRSRLIPLSLVAIVMGIGIELIFTKLFTVPLP